MKSRTILLLTLSLIVLSTIYYFDTRRLINRRSEQVREAVVVPFEAEDLTRLKVEDAESFYVLEKKQDGWWITEPIVERANQPVVTDGILKTLYRARKYGDFPASSEEKARYGLADEGVRVILQASADAAPKTIILGADTPIQGESYLADTDEPGKVYLVTAELRRAFDRSLLDLRDRRVFPYSMDLVTAFRIKSALGNAILRQDANKIWSLVSRVRDEGQAGPWRADSRIVRGLLENIQAMAPVPYAEEQNLPLEKLRVTLPRLSVEILDPTAQTSETRTASLDTLAFYRQDQLTSGPPPLLALPQTEEKAPDWLAKRKGRDLWFRPRRAVASALERPAKDYRDRLLFAQALEEVTSLEVSIFSSKLRLTRNERQVWTFKEEPDRPVHQDRVEEYLRICLGQELVEFSPKVPEEDTLEFTGLGAPMLTLRLGNEQMGVSETFYLGAPSGDSEGVFYGRGEGSGVLYGPPREPFGLRLTPDMLEKLLKGEAYFAARPMIRFQPNDITRIDLISHQGDGTTFTLRQGAAPDAAWLAAINGEKGRSTSNQDVQLLLATLHTAEYVSQEKAPSRSTLEKAGLVKPVIELILQEEDTGNTHALYLGGVDDADAEEILVRVNDDEYYHIRRAALRDIERAVQDVVANTR